MQHVDKIQHFIFVVDIDVQAARDSTASDIW